MVSPIVFKKLTYILSALTVSSALSLSLSNAALADVTEQAITLKGSNSVVHAMTWRETSVEPKIILVAIHGGVQNSRNYTAIAKKLAGEGILTYSIDLRGHGEWLVRSKGRPELNYNASAKDVISLTSELRAKHPGLPVFCIGESLGASTALNASVRQPELFDGLILVSPGTSPAGIHMKPILGSVLEGIKSLGTDIDLRPHITHISEDPRSCSEMITDPRTRVSATVPELLHMASFVRNNKALASKLDPDTPLLVMRGSIDGICSPESIAELYDVFKSTDKSFKTIEGCGHLLVTTDYLKPEIVTIVADWLKQKSESISSPSNVSNQSIEKIRSDSVTAE